MKKVLSIVLSIAMVLCMMPAMAFAGTATASQAAASYSDTEGLACEGAVNVLHSLGVVDGYSDGTYKPEQVVTRAEMAKLIITALGVDAYASATTSKFTDMGAASWAIPYVEYASNLNIIKGYGYGLFGPNDPVTYEQALTMVVRALGYTDDAKEMNGSWPAIYVQKASALGLLEDVENGGSVGANRGDIAIILYNALDVAEVYVDADGVTQNKKGAPDPAFASGYAPLTMMSTLNKQGESEYKIVDTQMADGALQDIRAYIGAAAKVTTNKDDDVIAVGDVKSVFITGDINSDGKLDVDGKLYTINDDAGVVLATDGKTTSVGSTSAAAFNIVNGYAATGNTVSVGAIKADTDETYTLAAEISGTTIKKIYSAARWTVTQDMKVTESDIAQISKNKKLLSQTFAKDDEGNIDPASFILNGVASLDDIAKDSIVYVYTNANNSKISRIDVGTEVIKGVVTKVTSTKVTVDGKAYKFSSEPGADSIGDVTAGDEIEARLDYAGKIYAVDVTDGTSGNYALIMSASSVSAINTSATGSDTKVQLYTADGEKVYSINGTKYNEKIGEGKAAAWSDVRTIADGNSDSVFKIVKYGINESGKITQIKDDVVMTSGTSIATDGAIATASAVRITKAGYLDGKLIADNAVIFSAPIDADTGVFNLSDDEDISLLSKSDVLNSDVKAYQFVYDKDDNKIEALLVDDGTTSAESTYGIVTSVYDLADSKDGVSFLLESGNENDGILSDNSTVKRGSLSIASKNTTSTALYKIKKTSNGEYSFESIAAAATDSGITTQMAISSDNVLKGSDGATIGTVWSGATIYIYDISEDKFYNDGTVADIRGDDVRQAQFYITKNGSNDKSKEQYGLIDYIVIYRN